MKPVQPASAPDRLRQFLTVVAILGSFTVNTLSNVYPLNGANVGQISNTRFADVLITPANYAFAIWGLIYLSLLGFLVYQFLPTAKQHPRLSPISYLLVLACLAQSLWIYLFQSLAFGWSVLAMLAILLCLIGIYQILGKVPRSRPWQERWLLRYPFSVYLGWIAVATVVNVATALYDAQWDGWGLTPVTWTVGMLAVSSMIPVSLLLQRRDVALALVFVWAFVAIALKRSDNLPIFAVALGLALLIAGLSAWKLRPTL